MSPYLNVILIPKDLLSFGLEEGCIYFHFLIFLSQVLRQKQVESPEVKQVSVRRFATFDLFSRKRLVARDHSDTSDDQWVEYRSVYFPEYSALLRYTHMNGST